jgi:hypothetical protein
MVAECVKTRQSRRCGEQCRRCRRLSRFCYSGLQRKISVNEGSRPKEPSLKTVHRTVFAGSRKRTPQTSHRADLESTGRFARKRVFGCCFA